MERQPRPVYGFLPADLLTLAYLAINLVLVGIGYRNIENAGWLLAGFTGVVVAVIGLRYVPRDLWPLLHFIRESYPLLALPLIYSLVGVTNKAIFPGYFDDPVIAWDLAIFGGHPNADLAARFPSVALSEILHLCYYSYYLLIPTLAFTLYFGRRYSEFRVMTTSLCATFYSCFVIFMLYPVAGPYYTFERVVAPGSVFPPLVYRALEQGAAVGAAFPSSHVAVAVVVAMMAMRFSKIVAIPLTIVAVGITVATVYGGFHYAIDAVAGLLFGILFGFLGPRIHASLLRRTGMP